MAHFGSTMTSGCTYCKETTHQKHECPVLKKKKKTKRDISYWERLIKNWGSSDEALQALYDAGDEAYGDGFKKYMDSISIFRDTVAPKASSHTGSIYNNLSNNEEPVTLSLREIMVQQQNGLA